MAEWQLVRRRVTRTRLGLWLVCVVAGAVALHSRGGAAVLPRLAVCAGMLGAVLGVAFGAGGEVDRAALALTLTHPTTPAAVALGRWLAAVTVGVAAAIAAVVIGAPLVAGVTPASALALLRAILGGGAAGGAAAGLALPGVWLGGNAVAGVLFIYIGLTSVLSPGELAALRAGLGWLPNVSTYAGLESAGLVPWLHVTAWSLGGIVMAALTLRRVHR